MWCVRGLFQRIVWMLDVEILKVGCSMGGGGLDPEIGLQRQG